MIPKVMRQYPVDWEPVEVPANMAIDGTAHIDSAYSLNLCRSELPVAVELGRGSQVLEGAMLDVGPRGRVILGECSMLNACWLIADSEISIGAYTMISWSAILMDGYRYPRGIDARRDELRKLPSREGRRPHADVPALPIRIGNNVWIGFEATVLPGVTIGDGAVIGARSVVNCDVEAYAVYAGNPARFVRRLTPEAAP